jgi:U3 small nucleolar RNA-associated protein 15
MLMGIICNSLSNSLILHLGLGSHDGFVHFFDVQKDSIPARHSIRVFQAHQGEVRTLAFTSTLHTCATFADDGDIRLWDLSLSNCTEPMWKATGAHRDRIRAAAASTSSANLLLSGSYDHIIKLWDTRADSSNGSLVNIDHGHPIEALLFHPNDRIVISAGGNVVKFWDISSATKPVKTLENHSRTASF